MALGSRPGPAALLFATTTAPYDEGGSVQPLAELLGIQGGIFTAELGTGSADGLAALRLASALVAAGTAPVLVCAAEARRGGGDGAVALLVGDGKGLAEITPAASFCEEIRDRWRPRGEDPRESDRSFIETVGTLHPANAVAEAVGETKPRLVHGPHAKAAARIERDAEGPGDSVTPLVGDLGAAHALMRLVVDGADTYSILALAGGRAELVEIEWREGSNAVREAVREQLATGVETSGQPVQAPALSDFRPYFSSPRSWRERGADFRLEGILPEGSAAPGRTLPTGTVVTYTVDHVYPGGSPAGVAAVDIEGGGRFFGQVTAGDEVAVGDPVRLVPRRLHDGGGVVQYFWKAEPWR